MATTLSLDPDRPRTLRLGYPQMDELKSRTIIVYLEELSREEQCDASKLIFDALNLKKISSVIFPCYC